jgi:hemerythrin-like domain-containing protein
MNTVLDALCTDHANFGKLLNLIEHEANSDAPDLAALTSAADYLADYPTVYHHPLEDAIYMRLKHAAPDRAGAVDGILDEHIQLRAQLDAFRAAIACGKRAGEDAATLRAAASTFVEGQWAHMESERAVLFPAAYDALDAADWAAIQQEMPVIEDPLQSTAPRGPLRRLHEMLVASVSKEHTASILARTGAKA